jgi:hypothetical protein
MKPHKGKQTWKMERGRSLGAMLEPLDPAMPLKYSPPKFISEEQSVLFS